MSNLILEALHCLAASSICKNKAKKIFCSLTVHKFNFTLTFKWKCEKNRKFMTKLESAALFYLMFYSTAGTYGVSFGLNFFFLYEPIAVCCFLLPIQRLSIWNYNDYDTLQWQISLSFESNNDKKDQTILYVDPLYSSFNVCFNDWNKSNAIVSLCMLVTENFFCCTQLNTLWIKSDKWHTHLSRHKFGLLLLVCLCKRMLFMVINTDDIPLWACQNIH